MRFSEISLILQTAEPYISFEAGTRFPRAASLRPGESQVKL